MTLSRFLQQLLSNVLRNFKQLVDSSNFEKKKEKTFQNSSSFGISTCIKNAPYSKMAAILVFFCLLENEPLLPRLRENILLNFEFKSEVKGANLQVNKRILKWRPFWNNVYSIVKFRLCGPPPRCAPTPKIGW